MKKPDLSRLLCGALAFGSAAAVYVDEAFKTDWHLELVGRVADGRVLSNHVLAVESEMGVIGALNTTNGELIWRRKLDQLQGFDATDRAVVAGVGNQIGSYRPQTGALEWDANVDSAVETVGIIKDSVYACSKEFVYEFDTAGNQMWKSVLANGRKVIELEDDHAGVVVTGGGGDGKQKQGISLVVIKNKNMFTRNIVSHGELLQVHGNLVLYETKGTVHVAKVGSSGVISSATFAGTNVHMRVDGDIVTLIGETMAAKFDLLNKLAPVSSETDIAENSIISFEADGQIIYQKQNGQLVGSGWVREEGLANAVGAVFIDLAELDPSLKSEIEHEQQGVFSAFTNRLVRHFHALKGLPDWWANKSQEVNDPTHGDIFGFKKLLVVASRTTGRVAALDTVHGQVVWALDSISFPILDIQSSGDLVILAGADGHAAKINGVTGEVLDNGDLKTPIEELLVSSNGTHKAVGAYTGSGIAEIEGQIMTGVYYVTNDDTTIYGHHDNDQTWTWTIGEGYKIVSTAQRDPEDVTASIGTILGDRRVLYKYLHPNAMSVAAVSETTGRLLVAIVDKVTGRILHSRVHDESVDMNNVSLVHGEFWIVYSYWSEQPTGGAKMVVWDLYENEIPNERWTKSNYSSFDAFPPPHVKTQSFFVSGRVKSMAVTRTKFGITNRDVLVNFENGQIMELPKRLLDARRPVGRAPTQPEMEEGLGPYEAMIERDPRVVLTHYRQVFVDNLITTPASVESTSLVAGYGLDIFFTRVTPSLPFDILNSNFGKYKLVGTIAALVVLLNVLRPIVNKRSVTVKWM